MTNYKTVVVPAIVMPNGEIISYGKTIGWMRDYQESKSQHLIENGDITFLELKKTP